jgi:ankyrin repeat protein
MSKYPYNADLGQTDLMGAAYNGDAEEVVRILTMSCDIDAQDDHGISALMYAAMEGHAGVVHRLIEHGANLEFQSASRRYTALMYAARGGHTSTVQTLLNAKADPDLHGDYDPFDTPLTIAAMYGFFLLCGHWLEQTLRLPCTAAMGNSPRSALRVHGEYHDISEFLLYHEKKPPAS